MSFYCENCEERGKWADAEIDRLRRELAEARADRDSAERAYDAAHAECIGLIDELAEVRKDAERYRWLRSRLLIEDINGAACVTPSDDEEEIQLSERIDGVIDAFLERKP